MASALHEDISRHAEVRVSSARSFGLWFTLIFLIIAVLPVRAGQPVRVWALAIAGLFLVAGLAAPGILQPLNRAWSKVGLLMGKIMNPLVLGVLFFLVITPIGWLLRKTGSDLLRLKFDRDAPSYWIPREPPGPEPSTMAKQF